MSDVDDFNQQIIEEFRANEGRVGGGFDGAPLLLLHSTGARSGKTRVNPLAYQARGVACAVFGSKAGADTNPDWFHNVVANPDVTIEVGTETKRARARVAEGDERKEIWEHQKQLMPPFAEYERKTDREIPVVVLEPTE
jgi:deazaflavin-dependent oxidoreductase (nitroreductase family)